MFGVNQEQPPHPTAAQAPTTAEEEALKRNTDCVYFLASPLTCKKGSECEYRHSDIARLNPRDCWYWLNGNCLNPKCGFRHPPLDGLLGTQPPTPSGPSLPPSQSFADPSAQAPYVQGKQAVPCIFFQRGNCLKGDLCPFMHGLQPPSSKVAQFPTATPVSESQPSKKTFGGLAKCSQEQKVSQITTPRSVDLPVQLKQATAIETNPLRNGVTVKKNMPLSTRLNEEIPRYKPANVQSASNGNSVSRVDRNQHVHVPDDQSMVNSKDADDFSREPSPGFDVLVDDGLRDSDYYPSEDQYRRTRGHEGRNVNATDDYEMGRSEYNSVVDVDQDMYREQRGYESFDRVQGHYGRDERRRVSSERILGGSAHMERRRFPRADSSDRVDALDLRHHLAKQKRGNGLQSVISHDHTRENNVEDQRYRAPRRDHLSVQESSVSSRFRGRIKIPGTTPPVSRHDSLSEREVERARHRGRLSPERPHGRLRDRIKGRIEEDVNSGKNFRGPHQRERDDNTAEFTAPKRLSELRVGKRPEGYEQHMSDRLSGKRKYSKLEGAPQPAEGDMSFEGPKPLSEILKRKRGGEGGISESGMTSANNEDNNQNDGKESFLTPTADQETNQVHKSKEESNLSASVIGGGDEKTKPTEDHSSLQVENEEGMIGDEAVEDQEAEGYNQREGEYEYEHGDGEDYNLDEGENVDLEEEYYEEDDDADDFAKKMGVMYS